MLNNYVKTFINQMSRRTGTNITEKHRTILEFAYAYYEKNRVGPLYTNIERFTGASREDIEELFPHGLNSVYSWVGIPIHSINDMCKPIAQVHVETPREVYFDYNATTPIRKEIQTVLHSYNSGKIGFGNPSSSTFLGKNAFDELMKARIKIARCLDVAPREIIFTGSGSESNNMAIKGIAMKYIQSKSKGHIITTQIEHPSVFEAIQFLGMFNFDITFLDVDKQGLISATQVQNALRSDTILVAVMAVNNEIGTVNPIAEIGRICTLAEIPFMVDGVQAFGKMDLKPRDMGISFLSLSAHKIYGPKGVGALYINDSYNLVPLVHGGEQEFHRRAGTENVSHIMAFGVAAELAQVEMKDERLRITKLRDYFIEKLDAHVPGYIINGSMEKRIHTNLNIGFPDVDSGALLISLNQIGIYVSGGSACGAGSKEASPVIKAIGVDTQKFGTVRFSFGLQTNKEDIDYLFRYLPEIISQIRDAKKDKGA
ncbi:MAG: cysteine desulfurase [Proteobacteria bacterium]|nr:cysteine desulfurase [Pseudomonadota bacterium]